VCTNQLTSAILGAICKDLLRSVCERSSGLCACRRHERESYCDRGAGLHLGRALSRYHPAKMVGFGGLVGC
jgi:hypothetical protein